MKKNYRSLWLRSLTGLSLVITLFISSSMVVLAAPGNSLAGEIIVSGQNVNGMEPSVSLNGENAITGRTFFSSAKIETPENISVTINLGKLGRVSLSPDSSLNLVLTENGISGELNSGKMQLFNSPGVSVNIRTNNDLVTNDASQAGDVTVDATSGSTVATSEIGEAFVNGEPAAAKMSKRKQGWIIFGVIAAGVATALIIYGVTRNDTVVSPRR